MLPFGRLFAAVLLPLGYVVLAHPYSDALAFVLFTVASLTDFLDGWLARRWGQMTALGRLLDPIADKAMVVIALAVVLALYGVNFNAGSLSLNPVFLIPIIIILLREIFVSGLREYLGSDAGKLKVTMLAKWKTTAQMFAIGGLFLAAGWNTYFDIANVQPAGELAARKMKIARVGGGYVFYISMGLLWIAAALTLMTGWDYFRKGMRYIREADGVAP